MNNVKKLIKKAKGNPQLASLFKEAASKEIHIFPFEENSVISGAIFIDVNKTDQEIINFLLSPPISSMR